MNNNFALIWAPNVFQLVLFLLRTTAWMIELLKKRMLLIDYLYIWNKYLLPLDRPTTPPAPALNTVWVEWPSRVATNWRCFSVFFLLSHLRYAAVRYTELFRANNAFRFRCTASWTKPIEIVFPFGIDFTRKSGHFELWLKHWIFKTKKWPITQNFIDEYDKWVRDWSVILFGIVFFVNEQNPKLHTNIHSKKTIKSSIIRKRWSTTMKKYIIVY